MPICARSRRQALNVGQRHDASDGFAVDRRASKDELDIDGIDLGMPMQNSKCVCHADSIFFGIEIQLLDLIEVELVVSQGKNMLPPGRDAPKRFLPVGGVQDNLCSPGRSWLERHWSADRRHR